MVELPPPELVKLPIGKGEDAVALDDSPSSAFLPLKDHSEISQMPLLGNDPLSL